MPGNSFERPLSPALLRILGAVFGRTRFIEAVNPELRSIAVLVPGFVRPWTRNLIQSGVKRLKPAAPAGVRLATHHVPGVDGRASTRLLVFDREGSSGVRPVLFWMHGGGYVIGAPEQDFSFMRILLDRLDVVVVSVDYRLAPDHPFPAPLDDCHAALCWMVEHADTLGIDPSRVIIGGQSAGGGLAAALVQRAVDTGPIRPVFQLLVYPMLDAMTVARRDHAGTGHFVWTPASNLYGWQSYLGFDPRRNVYPSYAVPASRNNLSGLPPAWIGVGKLDLFYEEDCAYAKRLRDAGVACDLHVEEGAYHGFDLACPEAEASKRFQASLISALAKAVI